MPSILPKIIGICGPIGAGKSTLAQSLAVYYSYTKLPFAQPLKTMLQALGIEPEALNDPKLKEEVHPLLCDKTPRWAMQTLGTEWGRHWIHPDLWTRAWANRATKYSKVIADDLRFPNEAQLVRALGGQVWRIDRPDRQTNSVHESEQYLDGLPVDRLLVNSGTIQELLEQATGGIDRTNTSDSF